MCRWAYIAPLCSIFKWAMGMIGENCHTIYIQYIHILRKYLPPSLPDIDLEKKSVFSMGSPEVPDESGRDLIQEIIGTS